MTVTADTWSKTVGRLVCAAVIVAGIALAAPTAVKLPKGFVQCKKNDPGLSECIKTSLQSGIPHMAKGVPILGLYPIDPLRINTLGIDQGGGPVSIKLNFRDLDISNIGSAVIRELNSEPNGKNMTIIVDFEKHITLDGNYDIKGKVIILPITGEGQSKFILENLKAKINMQLTTVMKNGVTYYNIENLFLTFTVTKMRIKLDNLFKGDKALGNSMNTFLNENWSDILKELQTSFENALAAAFAGIAQQVFNRVPANQIFID